MTNTTTTATALETLNTKLAAFARNLTAEGFADVTHEELEVLVFHDTREDLRWFMRSHTVVGKVTHPHFDRAPLFGEELLAALREHFGPEATFLRIR